MNVKVACAFMLKKMRYSKPDESGSVGLLYIVTRQYKGFCFDFLLSEINVADVHVLPVP